MTIAACYLSAEGVVFGADSTTTMRVPESGGVGGREHHYNFAQKIFQIGENSTLGITMWGLGGLPTISYRTLIAQFADSLLSRSAESVAETAKQWSQFFWAAYSAELGPILHNVQDLQSQPSRTAEEEAALQFFLQTFSGGFCIGGYVLKDRRPAAFEVSYNPTLPQPNLTPLKVGRPRFWGCPNLIDRLQLGIDRSLIAAIVESGKWTGSVEDLLEMIEPYRLGRPFELPIREAIDWIHASIYTTIKTMKFSHLAPVCGGPIEIAVITTDRKFRWVRHKRFDVAIGEEGFGDAYRPRR